MQKKNRRIYSAVVFFGAALVLCTAVQTARGYEITTTDTGIAIRWPGTSAGFYFNPANAPLYAQTAVQNAMNTWTAVASSSFSFNYSGQTASTAYGQDDGKNIISFGSISDENTLALNTFIYNDSTGRLLDSDIKFNTYHSWATDSSPYSFDVQTIALHELGHALSLDDLDDIYNSNKVMYGWCSEGDIKRSLTQDDINGISYLYPGGSGTTTTTIYVPGGACPAEYALGQDDPDLENLRALRDSYLGRNAAGRRLIGLYYENQVILTRALAGSPALRDTARIICRSAARVMKSR